jgi:hypothetical protein
LDPARRSVVFAGEEHAALLCAALPEPYACVMDRRNFARLTAKRGRVAAAFVDLDLLGQIDGERSSVPIVGITDARTLPEAMRAFARFPWLSHLVSADLLASPQAATHLAQLLERMMFGVEQAVLGPSGIGRVAMLARASRRAARFDRIHEFFSKRQMSTRMLSTIDEIVEELVMNALYDAPFEAGYFSRAMPRTQDVELPPDRACEISYGIERDNVFVRVRDPFGALTRVRLLAVLDRCSSKAVSLDESRGGAGLGLWRVFASASSVAITVVPGRATDILVRIATKNGRFAGGLAATHLYLSEETSAESRAPDDDGDLFDHSVTLVGVV